ncbi:environmental stress-induced protein Ves [Neorhizobium huautlense]|uniref:Environmental stress-induced protein Ves n=1 Tax=Neorhizobium huautlense TaxID=67774 RepID=A0ABT9PN56_9HYPH|nr:HutD family protein [Neorhizobium huautlense]MDP9835887.1 environmental stress-induced protein Ves [Neorhizobium huautlense]
MRILRAAEHRRMPWKNGRGETVEIAVFPPDATVDTFEWRISMATVSDDGPFSIFPGIDRTLSILEGAGLELFVENRPPVILTQDSAPYPFPADAQTTVTLVDGTITDLNVMTRRGRFSHGVKTVTAAAALEPTVGLLLMLCHRGEMEVTHGGNSGTLKQLDCAMLEGDRAISLSGSGTGFMVRLSSDTKM